ncbi:ABC transporter permease [Rhodovibrio salinarum]|uniref:ABC transporter permease n=1 Tax=Rhodovibrio salinarum TaxID=1087 RepID=A0A934QG93_9PROT|nr:ABC transporter permease [Rhodovibrio salinarum]MBK1696213.1 ABC transporter permease [Rhodovibrio salinarum]
MTTSSIDTARGARRAAGALLRHLENRFALLLVLWGVAICVMSLLSPYFLQVSTLPYFLQYIPVLGLLGMGQTLVMLAGGPGIDISVGSAMSLSGVFLGWLLGSLDVPILIACLACLAFGAGLGFFNGVLVNVVGIPSLMATLATYFAFGGLALALTGGRPQTGFPDAFAWLGAPGWLDIPNHVFFVFVPVAVVLHIGLSRTVAGRHVYACGNNEKAARLLGIKVDAIRLSLYTLSGALAGLAAIVSASWLMSASPDAGEGLELLSVTIAVLGGTHIFGGEGDIRGTVLAILIVTTLQTGLELAGISMAWQLGVIGGLMILSVAATQAVRRRRAAGR